MSDLILEKLKNELIESVKTMFDKKTSPYDTEAVVTRVDGDTAYVHIEGGVSETPVRRTINAKKGDKVQVRLSGGRAWLTGNDTAPPTDDTKAKAADAHAGKAMKKAVKAEEKAKQSGKTATLYVTEMDENVGVFVHPKGTPSDPTDSNARGVQITEDVDIIRDGESIAEFGSTARIGKTVSTNYNVEVDNSSVKFNKGTDAIASIGLRQVGFSSVVTELKAESADGDLRLKAGDNTFIDVTEDTQTETSRITIYTDNNQIDMTKYGVGFHAYKYSGGESLFTFNCSDSGVTSGGVQIGIGAGGINHGLYSIDRSNYLIYGTNSPTKTFLGGNAGDRVCPGRNSTNGTNGLYLGDSSDRWNRYYGYTADNISSDRKIKDNIKDIDFANDLIMGLEPVEYHLKDSDHRRKHMGFIAQDVAEVCKGIGENLSVYSANYIDETKGEYHGEDVDDSELSWGIAYTELIAPIVKVVQDQHNEIKELKDEIKELKEKIK